MMTKGRPQQPGLPASKEIGAMLKPYRFLIRMAVFLAAVGGVAVVLYSPLKAAFLANAPLNGLILGVLVAGILYNFRQVIMLAPEAAWLEAFRNDQSAALSLLRKPRLLGPMATMLGERHGALSLSALSMRSLLDGIALRLDESRDLSRYTIGLLIFLGLLGTFWGLLETVESIRGVIGALSVEGGDLAKTFSNLKQGLEQPLSGMGTAFSSSLFGLAGSLALGFLDLQAGQAQNRFFNDLEEWLSGLTRLSSGSLPGEGDHTAPAYVQALLEQMAEGLENLQRTIARGEEGQISTNNGLSELTDKVSILTDHMRTEQALMMKLAENQAELRPVMVRLAEDLSAGRENLVQQLHNEIKLLARTIAASKDNGRT